MGININANIDTKSILEAISNKTMLNSDNQVSLLYDNMLLKEKKRKLILAFHIELIITFVFLFIQTVIRLTNININAIIITLFCVGYLLYKVLNINPFKIKSKVPIYNYISILLRLILFAISWYIIKVLSTDYSFLSKAFTITIFLFVLFILFCVESLIYSIDFNKINKEIKKTQSKNNIEIIKDSIATLKRDKKIIEKVSLHDYYLVADNNIIIIYLKNVKQKNSYTLVPKNGNKTLSDITEIQIGNYIINASNIKEYNKLKEKTN